MRTTWPGLEPLEHRRLLSAAPTITATGQNVPEGDDGDTGTLIFTVTRSGSRKQLRQWSVVDYTCVGVTAEQGVDFAAAAGRLVFRKGDRAKTIAVTIHGTDNYEGPAKLVKLRLKKQAVNATVKTPSAFGAIIEDDSITPGVTIADASILEGDAGAIELAFTVTLSHATTQQVVVLYQTDPVTATADSDYTTGVGALLFEPGQTSQNISIGVLGDALVEGDETFRVVLYDTVGGVILDDTAIGTILDDD